MARQNIGIGTTANDGTGDDLRDAMDKTNDNFIEIYDEFTGWGDYTDTEYTTGSPFSISDGTQSDLPNNAATIVDSQKPSDVTTFYYSKKINITGVSGTFVIGEVITGGTSGATGTIYEVDASFLLLCNTSSTDFVDTETVTGGTSAATATVSGAPLSGAIAGRNGDGIGITMEFKVRPTTAASNIRIQVVVDIGGAVGELYPRDFSLTKGSGVEHYYLSSFSGYTLGTWESNGGIVKVEAINSGVEIYDIRYVITRTHKAR